MIIPLFRSHKLAYVVSLLLGAIGFASAGFITNQYLLFVSYLLIGAAWAAMLALPFTILTNSLTGEHMGTYLGLFNGTIHGHLFGFVQWNNLLATDCCGFGWWRSASVGRWFTANDAGCGWYIVGLWCIVSINCA